MAISQPLARLTKHVVVRRLMAARAFLEPVGVTDPSEEGVRVEEQRHGCS